MVDPSIKRSDYNRFQKWKIMMHDGRIRQIIDGQIPSPVEWIIYPSNVCGYQCSHCIMAREQVDHRNTLSADAMWRIPLDAQNYGISCVVFSGGGDPLLNKHTLETAKDLKPSVSPWNRVASSDANPMQSTETRDDCAEAPPPRRMVVVVARG